MKSAPRGVYGEGHVCAAIRNEGASCQDRD
jgi:hypothetical protein